MQMAGLDVTHRTILPAARFGEFRDLGTPVGELAADLLDYFWRFHRTTYGFDGVPIHIPSEYMFAFDRRTYANCDNVSGHSLDRVCREVAQLVSDYPDRLTIASTGGMPIRTSAG